ncbi:MAG TPA: TonB-dependent receptor plug domain-containing protein, partial [Vicinamibacterales bacterium]|nr:TonB-dependent receptor plug domain-containing protein [Vicinamibacterales bacterium]
MLPLVLALALAVTPSSDRRGRVVDAASGQPIAGADVTIVGRSGSVRTDRDGAFVWTSLPDGPLVVIVTLRDGRVARPIEIGAAQRAASPIVLAVTATVTEAITVTGIAPAIDTAPGASTRLVTAADIELRHPLTVAEALEGIPGVSLVGDGQSPAPALRGLARGRTLILVDGSRASTEKRSGATASFLDPIVVRSIEVARGPASVAYGSEAFGGVIAVTTRRPVRAERWRARFSGTAGAGIPEGSGDLELSTGYGNGGVLV